MHRIWLWGALFIAVTCGACGVARADSVRLQGGSTINGRVQAFDRQSITFSEGCGDKVETLPWNTVTRLDIDERCGASAATPSPTPAGACAEDGFWIFAVTFQGDAAPALAEAVALTKDRVLHLDLFEPWSQAHGPIENVRQVVRLTACRERLRDKTALPATFCSEPRQMAVAFDYKTPLSNRIFTNGFSFYVRVSGSKPESFDLDAFRHEVRSAFQHGISLWTSALHERQHLLDEPLRRFLETRISRSASGYVLLMPPQVIELRCPQTATFVVDLSFGNRSLFPRPPLVLAKAQTEGRTVALNVFDIRCYRTEFRFNDKKQLSFELPGGCLNLVPIMTHELGHAFGIKHIDGPQHALMDSRFSRDALVPTDRDVVELVAVLNRSIVGTRPGEIMMVSSDGVQPPHDFVDCADRGEAYRGC